MANTEDGFKQNLIAVLSDLQANGRSDKEAMWLLGGLASRLVEEAKKPNWVELKQALSTEAFQSLLATFRAQAKALAAEDKRKAAYAIEILAISLIARTQKTPEIVAGDQLLDEFIEAAIRDYRTNQHLAPAN
jgi:hypothetical protein